MSPVSDGRRRHVIAAAVVLSGILLILVAWWIFRPVAPAGPTVGDRLTTLEVARASLQAHADADAEARIGLLTAFRTASLLGDALALREGSDRSSPVAGLPDNRRRSFEVADSLNAALAEALAHPGKGTRQRARAAAVQAQAELDRLAGDGRPLVLQFSPRFVPPRRASGELALAPKPLTLPFGATAPRLDEATKASATSAGSGVPLVPRYVPPFAERAVRDFPVAVEIAATGFDEKGTPPTLAIGAWRGAAVVSPLRLRFSVPRSAFATNAVRTGFAVGLLSVPGHGQTDVFQLLFTVLPDQPGSFAFDQKVRTFVPESNTLVSPEILVRGEPGKPRSLRRCFDPPAGQHFDKTQRRIVSLERLGWLNDESDSTLNDGTAEFAPDEKRDQICIIVTAKPTTKEARTATIARFEATLVQETAQDRGIQSGVRALDWSAPVRLPIDPGMSEGRLYLRLLGEIDQQVDRLPGNKETISFPFIRVSREDGMLVLRADPDAAP